MLAKSRWSAQAVLVSALGLALLPPACGLPDYDFVNGPNARPSCASDEQCATFEDTRFCNQRTSVCVQCVPGDPERACGEGQYCYWNRCLVGCSSDDECTGELTCDVGSHQCSGCSKDADCSAGTRCQDSRCAPSCEQNADCPSGFACCAGACRASASDPLHCGSCTRACGSSEECVYGRCLAITGCAAGMGDCDGDSSNGCETALNDLENCAACATPCDLPGAASDCSTGTCKVAACESGYADCDPESAGCEALGTRDNCSKCGDRCEAENVQTNNCLGEDDRWQCEPVCVSGYESCDGNPSNGCEAALESAEHCGGCGIRCKLPNTSVHACVAAECQVQSCNDLFANCDGVQQNGCERDVGEDPMNCGGCGVVCSSQRGVGSCLAGKCQLDCQAGFEDCNGRNADGCEQDITSNRSHCGACDMSCSATQPFCIQSQCRTHLDIVVGNTKSAGARGQMSGRLEPLTLSHDLARPPSARRLVLAGIAVRANANYMQPEDVTYGGARMVLVHQVVSENQAWSGIYALANSSLPAGAYNLIIYPKHSSNTFAMAANVIELDNVEAVTPMQPSAFADNMSGSPRDGCSDMPIDSIEVRTEGALIYSVAGFYTSSMPSALQSVEPLVSNTLSNNTGQLLAATGLVANAPAGPVRVGYRLSSCNSSAHAVVAIKPAVTP